MSKLNLWIKNLLTILLLFCSLQGRSNDIYGENDQMNTNVVEQSFDVNDATQQYLDTLSKDQKERSDAYFEGGYWLLLWAVLIDLLIAWLFLAKGLSYRIKKMATKITGKTNLQNFIYITFYTIISYVLLYPWTLYKDFFREHNYDLSNQSWGQWMGDELIGLILFTLFGSALFMCLYIAIRKAERTWWLWGSGITFIFLIIIMFISPVFINPLFNEYKPLEEGPVKESILSMARANGVPVDNVYMFNASKQSDRISAKSEWYGKHYSDFIER